MAAKVKYEPALVQGLNRCCEAYFNAAEPQLRAAATAQLKALLLAAVNFPPGTATSDNVQVLAGLPAALPFILSLLRDPQASVWTSVFAAGSLTFCMDNFFPQLDQDTRFNARTQLLSWLAARGLDAPSWARSSAVTCLARMTTYGWRSDPRNHATVDHVLEFLAPGRDAGHVELGLELVTRLTEDQMRSHAGMSDNTRPTVRLLLYRDLALRRFVTRMVGLAQELLAAAVQAASAAVQAQGTSLDPASLAVPLRLATKTCAALHVVLTTFRWSLSAPSDSGPAGEEDANEQEVDETEVEASAILLPASWDAFRTHGPAMTVCLWARLSLLLYHISLSYRGQSHSVWCAPTVMEVLPQLGIACLDVVGDMGASKSPYQNGDQDQRTRRALFMRAHTACMLYAISCPAAAKAQLQSCGWVHALARSIFRSKLTLPLVYMWSAPEEAHAYMSALSLFTYSAYARRPMPVGHGGGSGSALPGWHTDKGAKAFPPNTALLQLSPTLMQPLHCPENVLYYLRSVWILLLMPGALLSRDDPGAHAVRSVARPLLLSMLSRYAPTADLDGPGMDESAGSLELDLDEDDAIDAEAGAANVAEQVEDDAVELAAEVARYCAVTGGREVAARIRGCTTAIMGMGTEQELSPVLLARKQRQLAWLIRFSGLLGTSVLSPNPQDDLSDGVLEEAERFDAAATAGTRADPRMSSLTFGEHWTYPGLNMEPGSALANCTRILQAGFEQNLVAPLLPNYTGPPTASTTDNSSTTGHSSAAEEGRRQIALRADAATTGAVPISVSRTGEQPGGLGYGASAPRLGLGSAAGQSTVSSILPSGTANSEAVDEDDVQFEDEEDSQVEGGMESSRARADATPRWVSVFKGLPPEQALLNWYEKGGNANGVYVGNTEDDDGSPPSQQASFSVSLARDARYAGLLGLPFVPDPLPSSADLRSARIVRDNGIAGTMGQLIRGASPQQQGGAAAPLSRQTPERIAAELATAVLRAALLLRMRNALHRAVAGPRSDKPFFSSAAIFPAGSSSTEGFAPQRAGAGAPFGVGLSTVRSPGNVSLSSIIGTPGLGRLAGSSGGAYGSGSGMGAEDTSMTPSASVDSGAARRGRGVDDSGEGDSMSAAGGGDEEDAALSAELDAVGTRLLANLQVGEGVGSAQGKDAATRPGAAGILSFLSMASATPASAAPSSGYAAAAGSATLSAPFFTPGFSTGTGAGKSPRGWTAPSVSLELALLSFFDAFHSWYARYRTAAAAVLALRSDLSVRGLLIPEYDDMPMLMTAEGAGEGGSSSSSRGSSRSLPESSPSSYVMLNGRLVPSDAADGLPRGVSASGMADDMGVGNGEGSSNNRSSDAIGNAIARWLQDGSSGSGTRTVADLVSRMEAEKEANVLLLVGDALGARTPTEILDMVVAKVLDNLRGTDSPASLVSSSLECLQNLALGVTVVVGSTSGSALLGGESQAGAGGGWGAQWTNGGMALPALPDTVSIGDDLLRTVCVKALLKKPGTILFPSLRAAKNVRLRTMLWGTLTRLLFLHARFVTAPLARLQREASADVQQLKAATGGKEEEERKDEGVGSPAEDFVFESAERGPNQWFCTFAAPLAATVDECRAKLGMEKIGGSVYTGEASYILSAVDADVAAAGRGGPSSPSDPRAVALRPILIGLLRDLRGVVAATHTPSEFRLVHDWLAGCGVHALLCRAAELYRGRACNDVLVPLLRLLGELTADRNSRLIFPPDNCSGYILVRHACRCLVSVTTVYLMDAQSGLGAVTARGGGSRSGATGREEGNAAGLTASSWDVKLGTIILMVATRLLTCRLINPSIPAAYGDNSMGSVAHSALSTLLALPLPTLTSRKKTLLTAMEACYALLTWPCPPQLAPLSTVLGGDPAHPAPFAVQGDPVATPSLPALQVANRQGIGLLPSTSAYAVPLLSVPAPLAVLQLLRLPTPLVAGYLARITAGLDRRLAGTEGFTTACDALDAILTVETDARMVLSLAEQAGSPIKAFPDKLFPTPSRMCLSYSCARQIVALMDAHASAPAGVYARGMPGKDVWAALASGALDRSRIVELHTEDPHEVWGVVGGSGGGGGGVGCGAPPYLEGVLGLDFMAGTLLSAVRETAGGTMHAWSLARPVLLNMLCRPASFGAAGTGLLSMCAREWRDDMAEGIGDLAATAEMLPEPTSNASKDAFASAFLSWARQAPV